MPYSIAICTFNGAKYLAEQIESILHQSMPPRQIVVSDDGSTDGTNTVVAEFIRNHPSVHWKHKVNPLRLGVIKNFEQAIQLCDEEIVFLSDQDDIWLIDKAECLLESFEKTKYSVVFTNAKIVDENLQDLAVSMFQRINFNTIDQQLFFRNKYSMYLLLSKYHATGATMAFRKSLVLHYMPFPEAASYLHDGWIATLAACCGELQFIDKPLILYRQHAHQQIGANLSVFEQSLMPVKFRKQKQALMEILTEKSKRNNSVLHFFENNPKIISEERLKILKRRKILLADLLKREQSFWQKLGVLSPNLYWYKIPEFQTIRSYLRNAFLYIFDR
ncbi:MAG TPA: glycosyltransferase family 2 protein [Bacteroidales bacterium]|nr:glycosyltransferase family 2 protein [Bacteroidales bacterium]